MRSAALGSGSPDGWLCALCVPVFYVSGGRDSGADRRLPPWIRAHNDPPGRTVNSGSMRRRMVVSNRDDQMKPGAIVPIGGALLQGGQPCQHAGIVLPSRFACPAHICSDRLTQCQGISLHADGDFCVSVGRIQTDVPQPSPDHVHFDTCLQQMDSRGVAAMYPTT
jgi:hypothetical protein